MAKPTPQKRPVAGKPPVDNDSSWLRHFLIVLGLISLVAVGGVTYYVVDQNSAPKDAMVEVSVSTQAGDGRDVQCTLKLVLDDPAQEKALAERMPLLRAAISETLGSSYLQNDQRPDMAAIPEQVRQAINSKLPRSMRVREVLIQQLLYGMS